VTPVPATTLPSGPLPSGTFQIQLASVPSEDAAQAEWKRVSGKHKDLLAAMTPAITKADLGEKGIYYRLRAGPLADKAAAEGLCASLAADRVGCIVIKP
jgi:cell division septation protein DedD